MKLRYFTIFLTALLLLALLCSCEQDDVWGDESARRTEKPVWNEEKYGKQLGMWQYTESGTLEGFSCYFDMNYAYKDYSEIMKKWGLNGF